MLLFEEFSKRNERHELGWPGMEFEKGGFTV